MIKTKSLFGLFGVVCAFALPALCAFLATASSAGAETFQCNVKFPCRAKIQGNKGEQQVLELKPKGDKLECRKFRAEGQLEKRSSDLQLRFKYEECSATAGEIKTKEVTVKSEHCLIRLRTSKTLQEKAQLEFSLKLRKPEEKPCVRVTIKIAGATVCQINIPAQPATGQIPGIRWKELKLREYDLEFKPKEAQVRVENEANCQKGLKLAAKEQGRLEGRAILTGVRIR